MNKTLPSLLKSHYSQRYSSPSTLHQPSDDIYDDILDPRIKNIIDRHPNPQQLVDPLHNLQIKQQRLQDIRNNRQFLKQHEQRRWLIKKGKKYLIDFDNQERKQMKQYFNSLDRKAIGSIGIDQLQELLLSVGLMETREEIKELIKSVDEDQSGKIQFGEFLSMIQNDDGQNEQLVTFFKTVIGGGGMQDNLKKRGKIQRKMPKSGISQILEKNPYPKGLSFQMVISHIRRKHMMTALNIGKREMLQTGVEMKGQQVAKGQRVMQALQKMYERKLMMQIKQSKRGSGSSASGLTRTEPTQSKKTTSQPWFLSKRSN